MKIICVTTILTCVCLIGCAGEGPRIAQPSMSQAYHEVTLQDGINKEEAELLANVYFTWHVSGCGAVSAAIDSGDQWKFDAVIGVAARPFAPIFVNKQTGTITCSKGLTVTAPDKDV